MVQTNRLQNLLSDTKEIREMAPNFLGAVASTLALFPAAFISFDHMTKLMQYPKEPAFVIACAVETLGYMIVSATVTAMERGRRGLVVLGCLAFSGYLIVIVLLNLILSSAEAISPAALVWAKIAAGADLAMLSVPAAILAALQSQMRNQDKQAAVAKQDADGRYAIELAEKAAADDRDKKFQLEMLKIKLDAKAKENDKKRESKLEQLGQLVSQVAPTQQNPLPSQKRGHIDLALLASKLDQDPSQTNDELGKFFGVSGEAVRLARKKL